MNEKNSCVDCGGPKKWGMFCAGCRQKRNLKAWFHAHTIYTYPGGLNG